MSSMTRDSVEFWSYSEALNVPREILRPYQRLVDRWLSSNGDAWTVDRLKSIYTDFIRWAAGLKGVGAWISRNKDGIPKGPCGSLFTFSTRGRRERFAAITLFRVYTRLVASVPTEQQMKKFLTGVTAGDLPLDEKLEEGVVTMARSLKVRLSLGPARPYWMMRVSPSKRVPLIDGTTKPESTHWPNQWLDLHVSYWGQVAMREFPQIFKDVKGSWEPYYDVVGPSTRRVDTVGAIGLIQEPGFKLRAVANPNRVYQMALEPLGDALLELLSSLPWDCTHNQAKAFPFVQQHLRSGKIVHSVDLSSATDYFPLSLQLCVLRTLVRSPDRNYVGLFEFLSRAPWRLGKQKIAWTRGQPLGLYPSFASFALTHGLLLLHLNNGVHKDSFFVLGDDVVILDDRLFVRYVSALKILGCPLSDAKSVNSSLLAEFAGKIITANDVFPQPKWRWLSDDNFLDILKILGKRGLLLLRPLQRKVAKAVWEIPDFLGGLGFNPHGVPLEDRCYKYWSIFGHEQLGAYLMSFDHQLNQFFNPDQSVGGLQPRPVWRGGEQTGDLDQKSLALVAKHLPLLLKWYKVLGTNLFAVLPQGDVLPRDGVTRSRRTLLDVLRPKLGI